MAPRILLVSPIPTHPQDQGNSARIFTVGRMFQSAGIIVHFLYYQMEGLTTDQKAAMEVCWDYFHPVATSPHAANPAAGDFYRLDEWWNPVIADVALRLHRRWHFRAVICNYVWFSAVLDAFGRDVLKVLDTHDIFGGRAERFVAAGMKPEWFYTSPSEEARGLARADVVLAIQDEEAAEFKRLGHQDVRVLGHLMPRRARFARRSGRSELTAGYLASGNPINVDSFEKLRAKLLHYPELRMRFVVAGSICRKLSVEPRPFDIMGRVDALDEFYDAVDVVVNPMTFGTGLKIKSVEAIFQGLPLVATEAAMTGLPLLHELHKLASPEDVADRLQLLTTDDLIDLARASYEAAGQYAEVVHTAIRNLISDLRYNERVFTRDVVASR